MNQTDRKTAPAINKIERLELFIPEKIVLKNNIPLYSIHAGTQEIIRIELLFKAGTYYQQQKLIAQFTNKMLTEGTKTRTADQIADTIDFFGAFVQTETEKDNASVTLYCLNKHFEKVIPVFEDIIKNAVFPDKEFSIILQNQKQQHIINSQKVNYIARAKFPSMLFGDSHPYGAFIETADYENLKRESLSEFYKKHYIAENCNIIIAGKVTDTHFRLIENHFGNDDWYSGTKLQDSTFEIKSSKENKAFILKEDAVQSAIRLGKIMVNKTNSDYTGLQILNTILGGYFGSRLMTNIREDKGYTYGIGSAVTSFLRSGMFFIASEVGTDVCRKALDEIYKELKILRTELISEDELQLVRNFMLGSLLRNADGPFLLADRFKSLLEYNMDENYYIAFIDRINNTTPAELRQLAEKYLHEESMFELIVGKVE